MWQVAGRDAPKLIVTFALVFGLSAALYFSFNNRQPFGSDVALALTNSPLKINFNFDPAKKEIFSFNLNKANLSRYNTLGFSVKKSNYEDIVSLRVEFSNLFNEKSEVYFRDIPNKWKYYEAKFSDFKGITDWSEMTDVSFIIEEWNTKENKGLVYIDNVRMSK